MVNARITINRETKDYLYERFPGKWTGQLPGFHDPLTRIRSIITRGHSHHPLFTLQPLLVVSYSINQTQKCCW